MRRWVGCRYHWVRCVTSSTRERERHSLSQGMCTGYVTLTMVRQFADAGASRAALSTTPKHSRMRAPPSLTQRNHELFERTAEPAGALSLRRLLRQGMDYESPRRIAVAPGRNAGIGAIEHDRRRPNAYRHVRQPTGAGRGVLLAGRATRQRHARHGAGAPGRQGCGLLLRSQRVRQGHLISTRRPRRPGGFMARET